MSDKIVVIPRTNAVFIRDSIVGVTEAHVSSDPFLRMSLKIVGVGFETEITSAEVKTSMDSLPTITDLNFKYELRKIVEKEAKIWHAEVVKAIFGDNNGIPV